MTEPASDPTFDGRAKSFDRRSAPPAEAAEQIARAAMERSTDGPLLDLGAGTGAIGEHLREQCRHRDREYLGLDRSAGMLEQFLKRSSAGGRGRAGTSRSAAGGPIGSLVRADAGRSWPIADGSIGTIFAARIAHLLDLDTLTHEIRRVLRPGGVVLLGTVRRDPESPRSELRRLLHRELEAHGVAGRSSRRRHGELAERLTSSPSSAHDPAEPEVVTEWTVRESLDEILDAWRRRGHLAGHDLPGELRREVLDRLEVEARRRYDPDRDLKTIERFEIVVLRP